MGVAHNFDDAVIFDDLINDEVIPNNSPAGSTEDQRHFIEEIKPLLDANQSISKHSFCTVPESVIYLNAVKGEYVNIPQYPIPYKLRPKIQEQIQTWLANGTIEKAPVNTKRNSPLTLAAKKDNQGNKSDTNKRVCLDTRSLNNILLDDDVQSLPHIFDIFYKLAGCSVFTTFDAFSAFHRFEIFGPDRVKTSWTSLIDGIQYCFKSSP
ncbi:acetyl-coenzyme-A carboxylase [Mucor velutinosus]|uniref:Acetyl-coenzyme-A carboxylase n=1 Tax=Mucor velutinosus TaxID=708070 RepID=A0AAN7I1E3_9FUNG|nr:acetyl-coenzyme-A carboxylase [Mucor velutinosus]